MYPIRRNRDGRKYIQRIHLSQNCHSLLFQQARNQVQFWGGVYPKMWTFWTQKIKFLNFTPLTFIQTPIFGPFVTKSRPFGRFGVVHCTPCFSVLKPKALVASKAPWGHYYLDNADNICNQIWHSSDATGVWLKSSRFSVLLSFVHSACNMKFADTQRTVEKSLLTLEISNIKELKTQDAEWFKATLQCSSIIY